MTNRAGVVPGDREVRSGRALAPTTDGLRNADAARSVSGRSRRSKRWLRIAILVALTGAGTAGIQIARAAAAVRSDLRAAQDLLRRTAAARGDFVADHLPPLDQAGALARGAAARLGNWPLRPVGWLPVLGRDVRVAQSIARAAEASVGAARGVVAGLQPLESGRLSTGTITAASQAFLRLSTTLREGARRVQATAPLTASRRGRQEFLAAAGIGAQAATAAGQTLRLIARFYGPAASTRYFLAFQNPAELRGTGGLIGQYGILESSAVGPRLTSVLPIATLQARTKGGVTLPQGIANRYGRFASDRDWSAINVSPDLPTVGAVIVDLYARVTGIRLQGVLAIDPVAAAAILRSAGPIRVGGYRLDAENVVRVATVEAYRRYAFDNQARGRFLADVSHAVFGALVRTLRTSPLHLVESLATTALGRHIQVYSGDPELQRILSELGVAGSATPPSWGDYLMPVGVNIAGNKLDAFLSRSVRYLVRLAPDGSAVATASVTLQNVAPTRGLPPYVAGPHDARFRAGDDWQFQTLYLAGGYAFTKARLNGRPVGAEAQDDLGALALSQQVLVGPGAAVTLDYDLRSARAARLVGERLEYRLLIRPQATLVPDAVDVSIIAPRGWRFLRAPSSFRVTGDRAWRAAPLDREETLNFVLAAAAGTD